MWQFGRSSRSRNLDFSTLLGRFHDAYGQLEQAMCLCEGFEIVAHNEACAVLVRGMHPQTDLGMNDSMDGRILPDLFDHSKGIECLLDKKGGTWRYTSDQPCIQLSARPWVPKSGLTLVEWIDKSELMNVSKVLAHARRRDGQTGLLLPGAFARELHQRLTADDEGILGAVVMASTGTGGAAIVDGEEWNDRVITISERLQQTLGTALVMGTAPHSSNLQIYMPTRHGEREGRHIMRQIHRVMRQVMETRRIQCGFAGFPQHGRNTATLSRAVALSLHHSCQTGEPVLFDGEIQSAAERQERLRTDFPKALENREITAYFQPIIHAKTDHLLGFEALVRWIHPDLGYVIPPNIVALAQECNLLGELTRTIFDCCVSQIPLWPNNLTFAVNVTPSQLTTDLVDMVRETVRSADIDPLQLEIEVTEDALIEDFQRCATIIARLRAIGVSIAMDDFGAGFTSLSNLRQMDVTKIKVDKSLNDHLPGDKRSVAIVKSLLLLGNEMDMKVTIEGIETDEQLDFLRPYNCGVQGYIHSKPLPADQLEELRRFLPT